MTISGTDIFMTRGDSESITVRCSAGFNTGDRITFTMREDVDSPIGLVSDSR